MTNYNHLINSNSVCNIWLGKEALVIIGICEYRRFHIYINDMPSDLYVGSKVAYIISILVCYEPVEVETIFNWLKLISTNFNLFINDT